MMENNTIHCGDCLDLMPQIADKTVDMVLCDLPYEVLHKNNPLAQWDRMIPFEPLWAQYERIIKDNGAIVLFAQGMFTAQLMMSNPKMWKYNLIWEKGRATGFLNANRMPMRSHEDICVFYHKQCVYNPQWRKCDSHPCGNGEHKKTNQCYGQFKEKKQKVGATYDYEHIKVVKPTGEGFPMSVLHFNKEHGSDTWHPTQKPVPLLRWLIRTYTNENDVVLDNCMGSGSTIVAAIKEKRQWIGIEKNKDYFEKAKQRIDNELMQPTLF